MASNKSGIKWKALNVNEKLEIIRKVQSNPTPRVIINKELGMLQSTLYSTMSKHEEILANAANLMELFEQEMVQNIQINVPIIKKKAEKITLQLNVDFQASNGWIDCVQSGKRGVRKCATRIF
ncbi:hypothetical protein PR048_004713 [Dryococelus australis]|uniref:HTH CENPB-type domain-containing protein n=1 Tax=Dryococelus australis TaxID=614101 RepID=A0ABQ9I838_9NEOP|nr:hypothetical protein PR048_004713 [Dryococelus australis]